MRVSGYPISSAPISGRGSSVARATSADVDTADGALIALAGADAALGSVTMADAAVTTLAASEWPL